MSKVNPQAARSPSASRVRHRTRAQDLFLPAQSTSSTDFTRSSRHGGGHDHLSRFSIYPTHLRANSMRGSEGSGSIPHGPTLCALPSSKTGNPADEIAHFLTWLPPAAAPLPLTFLHTWVYLCAIWGDVNLGSHAMGRGQHTSPPLSPGLHNPPSPPRGSRECSRASMAPPSTHELTPTCHLTQAQGAR